MIEKIKETILDIIAKECSKNPSVEEIADVLSHHPLDLGTAIDNYWASEDISRTLNDEWENNEITDDEFRQLSQYPYDYDAIWNELNSGMAAECQYEVFDSHIKEAKKALGIS